MSNIYLGVDGQYRVAGGDGSVPCKDGCADAKWGLAKRTGIVPGVRCGFCGTHWIKLGDIFYLDPDPKGDGLPENWEWVVKDGKKVGVVRAKCTGYGCKGRGESSDPHTCPFSEEIHDNHEKCNCCAVCTVECRDNI